MMPERRRYEATGGAPHFHVHVVPRRRNDGLQLPWTSDTEIDRSASDPRPCARCSQPVDPAVPEGLQAARYEKDGTPWHDGCAADIAHEQDRDRDRNADD